MVSTTTCCCIEFWGCVHMRMTELILDTLHWTSFLWSHIAKRSFSISLTARVKGKGSCVVWLRGKKGFDVYHMCILKRFCFHCKLRKCQIQVSASAMMPSNVFRVIPLYLKSLEKLSRIIHPLVLIFLSFPLHLLHLLPIIVLCSRRMQSHHAC